MQISTERNGCYAVSSSCTDMLNVQSVHKNHSGVSLVASSLDGSEHARRMHEDAKKSAIVYARERGDFRSHRSKTWRAGRMKVRQEQI